MLTQSPLAGTVVGLGVHTITITATDAAGNTSTAATTFTVIDGRLTFSLSVSPTIVKAGKLAKLEIVYSNNTNQRLNVSFVTRYTGPCASALIDNVGPFQINGGAQRSANVQFHVPNTACSGSYTLILEAYVEGVLVGTTTTGLTVAPEQLSARARR
jgi:hypothetical protein